MLAVLFWSLFFILLAAGILLKNGISVDRLRFGPVEASEITILWHHKLSLEMGTLSIKDWERTPEGTQKRAFIRSAVNAVAAFDTLFSRLSVKSFKIKEIVAFLDINQINDGIYRCEIRTETVALLSEVVFNKEKVRLKHIRLSCPKFKTTAEGDALLDGGRDVLQANFEAAIAESLDVLIDFNGDNHKISYRAKQQRPAAVITPVVDLFGLEPSIQHWITGALSGRRYTLDTFKGEIYWDAPGKILENLFAAGRIEACRYTFAEELKPVESDNTEVVFRNGVLVITPHGASYKGTRIDDGRVEIDFNDPFNIILSIHINTRAAVNPDVIELLRHYHISLPFEQTAGKTNADLLLKVNLNTHKVSTKGRFEIAKGEIAYKEKHYQVGAAVILLNDSNVVLEHLELRYQNIIEVNVAGELQLAEDSGDIDILVKQINVGSGDNQLQLSESNALPRLKFRMRPEEHTLSVSPSYWKLGDMNFSLSAVAFSLDDKNLSGKFSAANLKTSNGLSTTISGNFSIKEKLAKLRCKAVALNLKDMVLKSPNVLLVLQYDQSITLRTQETSHWQLNGHPVTLYPLSLIYDDKILDVADSRITYSDLFDSRISGHYDISSGRGFCRFENIFVKTVDIEEILGLKDGLRIDIDSDENGIVLSVSQLNLVVNLYQNKSWDARLGRLEDLAHRIALLKPLKIKSGYLKISSANGDHPFRLRAEVHNDNHILMKAEAPVDHLQIKGDINAGHSKITVNDDVEINVSSEGLHVYSRHLEYNVPVILDLLGKLRSSGPKQISQANAPALKSKAPFVMSLDAEDSALFIKSGSRVLADRLHMEYIDGRFTLQLAHDSGNIYFDLKGKEFIAEGNELNGKFIQALISESDFRRGRVSIAARGTLDRFSLLFTVRDTIIKNLRALNTIFAFLNTVPALVTFSLPKYNSEGLPVTEAVAGMTVNNGRANFEGLWLDSPELSMTGSGWMDFKAQKMNIDLKITSQAKSNLQKIPFLGYILAGDETTSSLTLDVTGDIKNPQVKNSLTRDIVRMPLDILWRTLKLPGHMAESILGY